MIATIHVMAFLCNWALVSPSILGSLAKDDGNLRIFKEPPNEFGYAVKRQSLLMPNQHDAETKNRRSASSTSSSSFIRFGRGGQQFAAEIDDNAVPESADSESNISRRWKAPDVVIRFGRSSFKTANGGVEQLKRGKSDASFIRFGRKVQLVPSDFDLSTVCERLMSNSAIDNGEIQPEMVRLLRLCGLSRIIDEAAGLDDPENQIDTNYHE